MNEYRRVDFMDKVDDLQICKSSSDVLRAMSGFFEHGKGMDYHVEFYKNDDKPTDMIYSLMMLEE